MNEAKTISLAEKDYYTVQEYSTLIKKSDSTIYNWHNKGYLTFIEYEPGRHAIPKSEYERYLQGKMMEGRRNKPD